MYSVVVAVEAENTARDEKLKYINQGILSMIISKEHLPSLHQWTSVRIGWVANPQQQQRQN